MDWKRSPELAGCELWEDLWKKSFLSGHGGSGKTGGQGVEEAQSINMRL